MTIQTKLSKDKVSSGLARDNSDGTVAVYYLASPYSHKQAKIRQRRHDEILDIAAALIKEGYTVLQPITMCHEMSIKHSLPGGYEFWKKRDREFIKRTDGVIVALMKGWDKSVGVADEVEYALSLNKPIYWYNPVLKQIVAGGPAKYHKPPTFLAKLANTLRTGMAARFASRDLL